MNEISMNDLEAVLADQIPEAPVSTAEVVNNTEERNQQNEIVETRKQPTMVGQKLQYFADREERLNSYKESDERFIEEKKLTRIGQKIGENVEIKDGWLDVDRSMLGDRNKFYPADWEFKIRPATVEAVKNWSVLDEENANSIDDVFNEILKTCFTIKTPAGPLPWGNLRSWDRFFFILLIREYTFAVGESKIEFTEDCVNCDNPVPFNLTSSALSYDLPDPEVMRYFDEESQTWIISRVQEKRKVDTIFVKFLPWMANKISKDLTIATRQIRELELKFKSWDTEMFSFIDDIVRNIMVTPASKLISTCPVCGEEVTAQIRFPNGIRGLFTMDNKRKKFGKK